MWMLGLTSPSGLDDTWPHSLFGPAGQARLHGRLRFKPLAQASTSHREQTLLLGQDPSHLVTCGICQLSLS